MTTDRREEARARLPDEAFNRWLDEAVTENCEFTVWDCIRDVDSAWAAWCARPDYAPALTPGYVLVPETPTQAMCQAGQWKAQEWPKFPLRISPIYRAMLAAAEQP